MHSVEWESEGMSIFMPRVQGASVFIPKDARPILIIPGFGGGPHEDFAQFLANEERTIVHLATFPHHSFEEAFSHIGFFESEGQNVKHAYYRNVLEEILSRYPERKCDLVGYSEGAMHAIELAFETIGLRVEKLYLANPAGLTGREGRLRILLRILRNFFHEEYILLLSKNKHGFKRVREFRASLQDYLRSKPLKKWWVEICEAGQADIREHLLDLCEYGHEIRIVSTIHDAIIDATHLRELDGLHPRIAFSLIPGTHQEIFLNPESVIRELLKK